jgi:hypothetical protein
MIQRARTTLSDLYESDETAWLDAMAKLIRQRRFRDLDYKHLGEYLEDMAHRDRREVESRLTVLLTHLLKWQFQSKRRSRSWRATILTQRQELARDLGRGVLRNHAVTVLEEVYALALRRAAMETGLAADTFPANCPYTLDQVLSEGSEDPAQ